MRFWPQRSFLCKPSKSTRQILLDSSVSLEIAGDGRGITRQEASDASALGLIGIRERMYALGGDFTIEGVPAGGTTLPVRLPLDPGIQI